MIPSEGTLFIPNYTRHKRVRNIGDQYNKLSCNVPVAVIDNYTVAKIRRAIRLG